MRSRPILFLAPVLLAVAWLLPACGSPGSSNPRRLSFASMQSLNPGVEGEWIVAEFPFARNVARWPDGNLKSLGYMVEDPGGKQRPLMLHFDETGMLTRKQYGGPLIRPPADAGKSSTMPTFKAQPGQPSHPLNSPAGYSESGGR
jgi:hypothetical protein